jgi:hypothetical protein
METPKALGSKKTNQGNRLKADCDFKVQVSLDNADTVIDGATLSLASLAAIERPRLLQIFSGK